MVNTLESAEASAHAGNREQYNAEVVNVDRIHDDLMILRIRPDGDQLRFSAGQYTVLGLGYWEPRVPNCQEETLNEKQLSRLAKRAYSASCALFGNDGRLATATSSGLIEIYVALVRRSTQHPPALTPRLFALSEGDRIYMSRQFHGKYTIDPIRVDDNVVFVATGTGEAPHNAMLAELLAKEHTGRIVSVACVRYRRDLAYLDKHREMERRFPNYRYLSLTTRESENLDASKPGYVGKRYLQEYFVSGEFESDCGYELDPKATHVFVCGNPDMIGVPHHTHDMVRRYPKPIGMIEVLERRGFQIDRPHEPGNIHFERYW